MEKHVSVMIFTFNLAGHAYDRLVESAGIFNQIRLMFRNEKLDSSFVREYLDHVRSDNEGNIPDMIIVNLQEASDNNFANGLKSDTLIDAFHDLLLEYHPDAKCQQHTIAGLNSCGRVGIKTGVIYSEQLAPVVKFYKYRPLLRSSISLVDGQHAAKGSILVDIEIPDYRDSSFKFWCVNTHLPFSPSHPGQGLELRNKTVSDTVEYFHDTTKINDEADIVKFYTGDLNYRVDFGSDEEKSSEYVNMFSSATLPDLQDVLAFLEYDQLEQHRKVVFPGYRDGVNDKGPIFFPSYKLNNDRTYVLEKNGFPRMPSWCDRILYYGKAKCVTYASFDVGTTTSSDHRPVVGLYHVYPLHQGELETLRATSQSTSKSRRASIDNMPQLPITPEATSITKKQKRKSDTYRKSQLLIPSLSKRKRRKSIG